MIAYSSAVLTRADHPLLRALGHDSSSQRVQSHVDSGCGSSDVAGCQQVEETATEDGENSRPFTFGLRRLPDACRLRLGEHRQPVVDSPLREQAPRAVGVGERSTVSLDPQCQYRSLRRRGQPFPHRSCNGEDIPCSRLFCEDYAPRHRFHLVGASVLQQCLDESILAAEQVQQHTRTRPDRGRQRS